MFISKSEIESSSYFLELLGSIQSSVVLPLECSFACLDEDENWFIKQLRKQHPSLIVGLGWEHGVKLKDNFILTEHFKWLISHNSLLILIVNDHYGHYLKIKLGIVLFSF